MFKVIRIGALLLACSALAKGYAYKHKKTHDGKPSRPEGPTFCSTFIVFTFTPRNGSTPYSTCPQSSSTPFTGDITKCPTLVPYPPVGAAIAVPRAVYKCEDVATLQTVSYGVTPPAGVQPIGTVTFKDAYVIDPADPTFQPITFTDFVITTNNLGMFTASGIIDTRVLVTTTIPLVKTGETGEYKKKYSDYDFSIRTPPTGTGFISTPGLYAVDQTRNIGYVVGSVQGLLQ